MGRITIPAAAQETIAETPYYQIQIIPDRINYEIAGGHPPHMMKAFISGKTGWNSKIQEYLEVLANARLKAIDATGKLSQAWLKYAAAADDSADPRSDAAMKAALEEFQRLACTGSSYKKLPPKAKSAAFWERASEVPLPRITLQEHKDMG
jgi:hypothetical protein